MDHYDEPSREMPVLLKTIILGFVGLFVVIGLIGLVLPIIPGILFLALAAWLLTKVSSRFAFHLEQNHHWIRFKRYLRSISFLSIGQQLKLTVLMIARSAIDGLNRLVDFLRK